MAKNNIYIGDFVQYARNSELFPAYVLEKINDKYNVIVDDGSTLLLDKANLFLYKSVVPKWNVNQRIFLKNPWKETFKSGKIQEIQSNGLYTVILSQKNKANVANVVVNCLPMNILDGSDHVLQQKYRDQLKTLLDHTPEGKSIKALYPFLYVKETSFHADLGLFTNKEIGAEKSIAIYQGLSLTDDIPKSNYFFTIKKYNPFTYDCPYVIDAQDVYVGNLARFANDARPLAAPNAQFILHHNIIILQTLKPIMAGSEITVDYGSQFWKHHEEESKEDKLSRFHRSLRMLLQEGESKLSHGMLLNSYLKCEGSLGFTVSPLKLRTIFYLLETFPQERFELMTYICKYYSKLRLFEYLYCHIYDKADKRRLNSYSYDTGLVYFIYVGINLSFHIGHLDEYMYVAFETARKHLPKDTKSPADIPEMIPYDDYETMEGPPSMDDGEISDTGYRIS